MLFRTVYGPELAAIYHYIQRQNEQQVFPAKEALYETFTPRLSRDQALVTQNVEDALSFLYSAQLIIYEQGWKTVSQTLSTLPFQLLVLLQLNRISKGQVKDGHPLDPIYGMILSELFVTPDKTYIENLHQEVNRLNMVRANDGISKEKIQSWKRVMEYLGVGIRVQNGFLCTYSPHLIYQIVALWEKGNGTMQEFVEEHFSLFLPCCNRDGEIAKCAAYAMQWLHQQGQIDLFPLQDSPTHFYFYDKKIRGLKYDRSRSCTA